MGGSWFAMGGRGDTDASSGRRSGRDLSSSLLSPAATRNELRNVIGSHAISTPYFGSGIYTWAALISTVLAAFTAGYFLGGFIGDRDDIGNRPRGSWGCVSVPPGFAESARSKAGFVFDTVDNVRLGSLYSALAFMFLPVTLLGVYSPFCNQTCVARHPAFRDRLQHRLWCFYCQFDREHPWHNIFLIPIVGTRMITLLLGAAGICCGLFLIALDRVHWPGKGAQSTIRLVTFAVLMLACNHAWSDGPFDENVRAQMLKHSDGRVAHIETEYNALLIDKHGSLLGLSSMSKWRPDYIDSMIDLKDPDAMPVSYTRIMPVALAYPEAPKRILMIGLGAGSISTYLARAMPDAQIDVAELDPGVIAAGKKYFGLLETDKVRLIESDGRVYLNRHKDLYDVILLDAFRELGVPFHLLTREFYALAKEHLAPGGAVASNVVANTKHYLSTLATLRAVFPTVDVYPGGHARRGAGDRRCGTGIKPSADSLFAARTRPAEAVPFPYSLSGPVSKRVTDQNSEGADLLTDDFAPADLYRVTPASDSHSVQ